jgi:TetR/AcrR family transcriptional regulator, cholesterol catabolism regulator
MPFYAIPIKYDKISCPGGYGMPKSKTSIRSVKSQLTRQRIFNTAVSLFLAKGYDKVTIDEICENVGLTKGAFYSHFKSKDQIVLERMLAVDEHYRTDILPQVQDMESSIDKILSFVRMVIIHMAELGKVTVRTAYLTQIGSDHKLSSIMTEKRTLYKIIQTLVAEAQNKGELRNDLSSSQITQVIMHNIRGIVYNWCLSPSKFDIQEAGEDLIRVLATGLHKT